MTPAASSVFRIRLRTGDELRVVEIGSSGARVEGSSRLLPNRHIDVRVATPRGEVQVRALVVRSRVSTIRADALQYESALSFEHPLLLASSESV